MLKTTDDIIQSRAGGRVERVHGITSIGGYSNAQHQWGVAMLMWYLWPEHFPRLAIYCISHDNPEYIVGDIPAPTKRYVPDLGQRLGEIERTIAHRIGLPSEMDLDERDMRMLKACDGLEFYLWCREQEALGNQFASEGRIEVERYFTERPLPAPADRVFEALRERDVIPTQAGIMKEICSDES